MVGSCSCCATSCVVMDDVKSMHAELFSCDVNESLVAYNVGQFGGAAVVIRVGVREAACVENHGNAVGVDASDSAVGEKRCKFVSEEAQAGGRRRMFRWARMQRRGARACLRAE